MFETVYNMATTNLMNFKCPGCNNIHSNNICEDLDVMYKPRANGHYIENYNCDGKVNSFVKKYGASYISEIYHYLERSRILEEYQNKTLRILALGCGFDPWYYAVTKYICNNNLNIEFLYTGYDKSTNWTEVRPYYKNVTHRTIDLTEPLNINFNYYDFVIVDKVFSTIRKTSNIIERNIFLENISKNFQNINTKEKHTLIFREQACAQDIYTFDFFIRNNMNWKAVNYFYVKGRETKHLTNIIKYYYKNGNNINEIYRKRIIYAKKFNNGFEKIALNSFFIQYSI